MANNADRTDAVAPAASAREAHPIVKTASVNARLPARTNNAVTTVAVAPAANARTESYALTTGAGNSILALVFADRGLLAVVCVTNIATMGEHNAVRIFAKPVASCSGAAHVVMVIATPKTARIVPVVHRIAP